MKSQNHKKSNFNNIPPNTSKFTTSNSAFRKDPEIFDVKLGNIIDNSIHPHTNITANLAVYTAHLTRIIKKFQKRKNSKLTMVKVANICKYVGTTTNEDSWVEVHFATSNLTEAEKLQLRNYFHLRTKLKAKTKGKYYTFSGIINNSIMPGCDSRIAIGRRSVLYGSHGNKAYSVGNKFEPRYMINTL